MQAFVHTDETSARAARSLGARAFTTGNNIFFGPGEYDTNSASGQTLLRHEMSHVLANRLAPPASGGQTPTTVVERTAPAERDADATAGSEVSVHPAVEGAEPVDGSFTTPWIHRSALPFASTLEIHHNLMYGRDFTLNAGEGVVVELAPDWYPEEEGAPGSLDWVDRQGPNAPPGLTDEIRVSLENRGWLFNSSKGQCEAVVGSSNRLALKTNEEGTHRIVLEVDDHNHNFYLFGPIRVRQAASDELAEACAMPEGTLTGSEILHDVLALAGLFPVLGIAADAADAGLYVIDGDWVQAGISAGAMIPTFGDGATLVRLGERMVVKVSKTAAKRVERRAAARALRETRTALKALRTPAALKHAGNRLGIEADQRLVQLARDVRVTQAGITREAFERFNVATARVRVGNRIEYLEAGNSPGMLMHSEDWLITQVDEMRRRFPGQTVVLEQLFSERIPCQECLGKLVRLTNAELFYTIAQRGSRAADLMRAYGL